MSAVPVSAGGQFCAVKIACHCERVLLSTVPHFPGIILGAAFVRVVAYYVQGTVFLRDDDCRCVDKVSHASFPFAVRAIPQRAARSGRADPPKAP